MSAGKGFQLEERQLKEGVSWREVWRLDSNLEAAGSTCMEAVGVLTFRA